MKIWISKFWKDTLSLLAMEVAFYLLFFGVLFFLVEIGVRTTRRMLGL